MEGVGTRGAFGSLRHPEESLKSFFMDPPYMGPSSGFPKDGLVVASPGPAIVGAQETTETQESYKPCGFWRPLCLGP